MMKTQTLLPLLLGIFVANYSLANSEDDEYDYMATPESSQIADLVDDDRDGVVNARDLCAGTVLGSQIDNDGCGFVIETEDELQLRILFANDSSKIEPLFENQIRTMSDFLKRFPETSIEVQGYASKVGAPEYNLTLSKKRAIAVEQELISNGLAPFRVTIVGYGESNLESDGNDELSHAQNRKVTATVVGFDEEVAKEWTIFSVIEK